MSADMQSGQMLSDLHPPSPSDTGALDNEDVFGTLSGLSASSGVLGPIDELGESAFARYNLDVLFASEDAEGRACPEDFSLEELFSPGLDNSDAFLAGASPVALQPGCANSPMETVLGNGISPTAEEAVAMARSEGLDLLPSTRGSNSGYAGVFYDARYVLNFKAFAGRISGKVNYLGSFATAEEAALHVARARAQESPDFPLQATATPPQPVGSDSMQQSVAEQDLALHVVATPLPTMYANAANLTRCRGSRKYTLDPTRPAVSYLPDQSLTQTDPGYPVAVAAPLDSNDGQPLPLATASVRINEELLAAAARIVDQANSRMNPGVCRLLESKREDRIQACVKVLQHGQTLVLSESASASGYNQVRVVGPGGRGDISAVVNDAATRGVPLRFVPAIVKQDGSNRQTIHGEYYELPELAASDLAVPLESTLPLPSAPVDTSCISDAARAALDEAAREGLTLLRADTNTGYSGVVYNPTKGAGSKESSKPYRVRVYDVLAQKRTFPSRWSSAEEAALARAKLLTSDNYT